jgi:aminoglycoside phosphotransferase (APT) family kinase protein
MEPDRLSRPDVARDATDADRARAERIAPRVLSELPGLNVPSIERWLVEHGVPVKPPLRYTRAGRGRSNLTFIAEDADGAALILRRPPLGPLLESAHDMSREYRILEALAPTPVPVPRPLAICLDPAITGAPFYAMERVEGSVIDTERAAADLGIDGRRKVGHSLARTLAALHAIDPDAVGLGELGPRTSYAERQLRRWMRQWEGSKTREIPALNRLTEQLQAGMPPARDTAIVHGDYSLTNLLVDGAGNVAAVLDWELCTLGEPLADLGALIAYWADAQNEGPPERKPVTQMTGFLTRAEVTETYAQASGRDVDQLPYYTALAYWRLAIIVQGVYRRWLEDPANGGINAGELSQHVDRLVDLAGESAAEARL